MSESNSDARGLSGPDDPTLESIIERFELAWQQGQRPDLDEFLTGAGMDRRSLVVELAHVDLEYRLKAGETARAEAYLDSYPELGGDPQLAVELIAAEYSFRRRDHPELAPDELLRRFPQHREKLLERFKEPAPTTRPRLPVRLNCPHCQNPIEIVVDETQEDVVCPSCGSAFRLNQDATNTWTPSKLPSLGKFDLIEVLGRGAFGTVYRALDTELQRTVAVKVPRSGRLVTQDDEERFVREARSVAQLQHPGIVPVYEVGRSGAFPYIVSEYVEGLNLGDVLTGRGFGFRETARLVAQVAEALDHAHQKGIVHRDVKPSNIMLSADGTPRLMDFGLAKQEAGEITVTIEGDILGTPAYMSPEQARGEAHRADRRTDVYSLGVVLFQLLTGEFPFRGSPRMLLHQILNDEPRSPRSFNDKIPRDLETICLKAMAKEPGRRYATAGELAVDLTRYLAGDAILARPVGRIERSWRWCRKNPAVASLSAAFVFALLLGTIFSTNFAIRADRNARLMREQMERANTASAREREASQIARDREQEARDSARQMRSALYRSRLEQARQLTGQRSKPGWSWLALEALEEANDLRPDDIDTAELRSLYARALCGTDCRPIGVIAKEIDASVLASSPGGTYLAVGQRKHAGYCSVDLYDPSNLERVRRLTFSTVSGTIGRLLAFTPKYQDGINALAFSPDEEWVVVGTRFGRIVRWNLRAEQPKPIAWQAHTRDVDRLVFSKDGENLYSCAVDGQGEAESSLIKIWSLKHDWNEIASNRENSGKDIDVAADAIVYIRNGRLVLAEPKSLVTDPVWPRDRSGSRVWFSRDGREIYDVGAGKIHVVERFSGTRNREMTIPGTAPSIKQLDFSPRGDLLVVADNIQNFHLIETATGRNVQSVVVPGRDNPYTVFSTDGRQLAIAGNRQTEIYEMRGLRADGFHRVIGRHPQPVDGFDLSPDGRQLAITGAAPRWQKDPQCYTLSVWDTDSGRLVHDVKFFGRLRGKWTPDYAGTVAFQPDSGCVVWTPPFMQPLAVTGQDGPAYLRDPAFPDITDLAVIQEDDFVVVDNSDGCAVVDDPQASNGRAMRIAGGRTKTRVRLQLDQPSFDLDNNSFAVLLVARVEFAGMLGRAFSFSQNTVKTSHEADVALLRIPSHDYHLFDVAYVPSAHSGQFDLDIWLDERSPNVTALYIDRAELVPLRDFSSQQEVMNTTVFSSLCFPPDEKRAWSIVNRKAVVCWDLRSGEVLSRWDNRAADLLIGKGQVNCLAAGTRWVIAGRRDGVTQILDATTGKTAGVLPAIETPVRSVALHDNQRLVAVGTEDGRIRLFDPASRQKIGDWRAHYDSVEGIVCDPNQDILISGSRDQSLRVWKRSGKDVVLLAELETSGPVKQLRVSDDGHTLAALVEGEHGVHIWNLDRLRAEFQRLGLDW